MGTHGRSTLLKMQVTSRSLHISEHGVATRRASVSSSARGPVAVHCRRGPGRKLEQAKQVEWVGRRCRRTPEHCEYNERSAVLACLLAG
ncbi:hypothetical protein NDU88_006262 [Pleurodeles waltl]|uniref:Uncharacterized protein n=1 Tax=Pleurodeles waltl TaxID=8319 RepID=A0AAV7PKX9_PLEWA|nr:hypothetical protein NDU88_006262 [Pleurodeles waltl]